MSEPVDDDLAGRFVARLTALAARDDRATLARLRRGLGKAAGYAPDRDGWVWRQLPDTLTTWHYERFCLVAALYALHPAPGGTGSLGAAFRRLQELAGAEGPERRFVALLDSDAEDLPERLRHAVTLLRAQGVPLDWARLLRDLAGWSWPSRKVQRDWAKDFWAGRDRGPAAPAPTPAAVTE